MSLGRRGSSAVRVPQFTLSPRLWISVTHVVVITESLTRDLGKLRHEGIPRASPRCCADHGLGCAPEVGLDLSSPPFPFQPQPQEPGPLLYSRSPCGWDLNSALLQPRPHVPRIFSTRLQLGSTRAPPALNPTRDASLSAPSRPHQALGVVPPLQSPQRHPPPCPCSLVAPRALPSPFSADSPLFPCGPTLSQNCFSALFWDVSPWGGGAGPGRGRLGTRGRITKLPRVGSKGRDAPFQSRQQETVPRTGS